MRPGVEQEQGRRWHEQPASLGALLLSITVALCGGVSAIVAMAVTNEARQSQQDRSIALAEQRIAAVERVNEEQNERSQRRESENRAAQAQEMAILTQIQQALAVHEARGGIGLSLRAPLTK